MFYSSLSPHTSTYISACKCVQTHKLAHYGYVLCTMLLCLFESLKALLSAPETPTEVKGELEKQQDQPVGGHVNPAPSWLK